MSWSEFIGLVLAAAGIALFLASWPRRFALATPEPRDPDAAPVPAPDELGQRLARRVRRDRKRRERRAMLGVGLIMAAWLILMVPTIQRAWTARSASTTAPVATATAAAPAPSPSASAPGATQAGPATTAQPPAPPEAGREHLALWPLAIAGITAMFVGGAVLLFGRSTWVRAAGAATLLSGLTANGYLIKEVKVGDIFKLEAKIDKPTLEIELNKRLQQLSEFGPEQLALLDGFTPGEADLLAHMSAPLQGVCERWKRWKARGGSEQRGLLLVVGSTDRVALSTAARLRYESNVGLARARAEQAKAKLVECDIPPSQLMTLVSGPRNTPVDRPTVTTEPGFAADRSVVVWALWSVPARLKQ